MKQAEGMRRTKKITFERRRGGSRSDTGGKALQATDRSASTKKREDQAQKEGERTCGTGAGGRTIGKGEGK